MSNHTNLSKTLLSEIVNGVNYIEEWLPIFGFEGLYSISSFGRIKAERKTVKSPKGTITRKEKILLQRVGTRGYLKIILCKEGLRSYFLSHRIVAEHFIDNPENKPQVNHIEGNKLDNRYFNLEWNTSSENLLHAYRIGLQRQDGEHHTTRKLNWGIVREIRKLNKEGISKYVLADRYNVHFGHIQNIISGKYWKEK